MAKHRSYSIEFERQVAQEYIAAQFPVVLARVLQGNLLELLGGRFMADRPISRGFKSRHQIEENQKLRLPPGQPSPRIVRTGTFPTAPFS